MNLRRKLGRGAAFAMLATGLLASAGGSAWAASPPALEWSSNHPLEALAPGVRGAYVQSVSCASETFCVAAGYGSTMFISRTPLSVTGTWGQRVRLTPSSTGINDISCPSPAFCAASAFEDVPGADAVRARLWTSTDPAGGPSAWTTFLVPGSNASGISCPSATFCAATVGSTILVSSDPAGGQTRWSPTTVLVRGDFLQAIACPSASFCIAVSQAGKVIRSTNPTDPQAGWSVAGSGVDRLDDISCPTKDFCAAVGQRGTVLTSTSPTSSAAPWRKVSPTRYALSSVACPAPALCAAGTLQGQLFSSAAPASAWADPVDSGGLSENLHASVSGISCPSTRACIAVDDQGNFAVGTLPVQVSAPRRVSRAALRRGIRVSIAKAGPKSRVVVSLRAGGYTLGSRAATTDGDGNAQLVLRLAARAVIGGRPVRRPAPEQVVSGLNAVNVRAGVVNLAGERRTIARLVQLR